MTSQWDETVTLSIVSSTEQRRCTARARLMTSILGFGKSRFGTEKGQIEVALQCDQVGLFLKGLINKFSYKSSENI